MEKNLTHFKEQFFSELKSDFNQTELDGMFNILIERDIGINSQQKALLNDFQKEKFEEVLSRLKKNEPIQYIIGETDFMGRTFKVNANVHVPRQETETMVNWIKEDFEALQQKTNGPLQLLDIGTGCGLLPVTLSKPPPLIFRPRPLRWLVKMRR